MPGNGLKAGSVAVGACRVGMPMGVAEVLAPVQPARIGGGHAPGWATGIQTPSSRGHGSTAPQTNLGLCDLKPDRFAVHAWPHCGPIPDPICGASVDHPKSDKVAAPELAVDGHVEQREFASVVCHLEPDADGPDLLRQERALLTDDPSIGPRRANTTNDRQISDGPGSIPSTSPTTSSGCPTTCKQALFRRTMGDPLRALPAFLSGTPAGKVQNLDQFRR